MSTSINFVLFYYNFTGIFVKRNKKGKKTITMVHYEDYNNGVTSR